MGNVGAGATLVVTAVVTAGSAIEPGTSLEFGGSAGSSTFDPNPANNNDNADTSITGLADLALSKTGESAVVAGGQVTYTIIVTNDGPSAARSVDIKDTLPPGVSLGSTAIQRSGSGLSACGGAVCQVGDMAAGATALVRVEGTVAASLAVALTNVVTLASSTPVTGSSILTAQVTTPVSPSADLALEMLSTPTVFAGESIVVTPTVVNNGPSYA